MRVLENTKNVSESEALNQSMTGIVREVDDGDGGTQWVEFDTVTDAETWDNQK